MFLTYPNLAPAQPNPVATQFLGRDQRVHSGLTDLQTRRGLLNRHLACPFRR